MEIQMNFDKKIISIKVAGRIKALLLRRHSDWFGDRFGKLRLLQRSATVAAAIEHAAIVACFLLRQRRRHAAIDETR